jgi:hypothetical protein
MGMTRWKPADVAMLVDHVAGCLCEYRPVPGAALEDSKLLDVRCIAAYVTPAKAKLIEPGDLKMTRDALCAAQTALSRMAAADGDTDMATHQVWRIGELIRRIDERRPLGPDGKHGTRHTPHCGCEDQVAAPAHGDPSLVRVQVDERQGELVLDCLAEDSCSWEWTTTTYGSDITVAQLLERAQHDNDPRNREPGY